MTTLQSLRQQVPADADLSYIVEDLRPLCVPIDAIHVDPQNARMHPEQNREVIAASLERFQQREALVVNTRDGQFVVESGNGRLEEARAAGWLYIAVVGVDDAPADARAFSIVANRSAELAEWSGDLAAILAAARDDDDEDLEPLGWTAEQVQALVDAAREDDPPEEFPIYDETLETAFKCPKCAYEWSGKPS